jgi:transcriptional regulator with XRE-family HTH domain
MLLGKKIKEIRNQHKMSLTELSQKSGVQLATLSRIEHLKMTGTLESHIQIAKAFNMDITELYQDIIQEKKNVDVQTQETKADFFDYNDKSSYEILTSKVLSKKMMPTLLKIEPHGKTNVEQNAQGTEKFLFVLEGTIKARVGEEMFVLSSSNTLYFDASLKHTFINEGKLTAKIICVTTPVAL